MKKVICLFASVVFIVNAEAQYRIKKSLGDFTRIELTGASKVTLVQSDSNYISIHSKDSLVKNYHAKVDDGVLYISSGFKGEVHARNISSIRVSDASSLTAKDTLRADKLTLKASDGGSLNVLVNTKTIIVEAADAGSIDIDGTTDLLAAKASDASRINTEGLKASTVKAVAEDASKEDVWAVNSIDAISSDASHIHIKGSPKEKHIDIPEWDGSSISADDWKDTSSTFIKDMHNSHGKLNLNEDSLFGEHHHRHDNQMVDAFIGFGFVTGGNNGPAIKYGNSREFIMGLGGGHKICKWDGLGFDVYYKSTDFFLAQNSGKAFPDTINHNAQKVSLQNFGGLIYDRIIFESGYHGIIALDLGFYGDWTFNSREVSWDNNYDVKTIDRNLSYFNHGNYGVTARFVFLRQLSVYCNYRLSNVFSSSSVPAQQNLTLPAYTMGITIGLDGVK